MKGCNYMILCESAMQEIVQEWLDSRFSDKVQVRAVDRDSRHDHMFRVVLGERSAKQEGES